MDLQPRPDAIVNQVWAHPPVPLGKDGKTLLVQMGGVEKVTQWVYGFYDKMLLDKEIAPFLKKSQATQSIDVYMKLLKDRTAEYLETVWGGDTWEGQDMFCAHSYLHITPSAFDRAIQIGKKHAKGMGLSSAVVDQIVQEMLVMKEPMTDPDGKFITWYKNREREIEAQLVADGAVDLTGMGFTTSPAMIKQMREKQEADEARRQRLAEYKKQRAQEEKRIKREAKQKPAQEAPTPKLVSVKENAARVDGGATASANVGHAPARQDAKKEAKGKKQPKGKGVGCKTKAVMEPPSDEHPAFRGQASNNSKENEWELESEELTEIILPEAPIDEHPKALMPGSLVTPKFRAFFRQNAEEDRADEFVTFVRRVWVSFPSLTHEELEMIFSKETALVYQ